jgi:hypothetical protein
MDVKVQLEFPHEYRVDVLQETGTAMAVRIPDAGEPVESLLVKISPGDDAPAWVGSFARGFETNDLVTGIYGWPDGVSIGVVSAGYGYVVRASGPKGWTRLQPMPITDVRVLPEHKLIIVADFTHIFAYGAEKSMWKTERLSWDGITITKVGTNHVFGLAWDGTADKEVEFVLDVRTGEHTGGAEPWAKK